MVSALFLQYLSSAVSLGLGCGTGCSPFIGMFLSTYTLSHAKSLKRSLMIFLNFFLGKATAIVLICVLSSFIGKQWIDSKGYIGSFNVNRFVEIAFLIIGIAMVCNWIRQRYGKSSCKNCSNHCDSKGIKQSGNQETRTKWPTFAVGFIYGITPCGPLILLIGYALVLSIGKSFIMAVVFSVVSSISPMLFLIFIAGILSNKMYEEIPKWIDWIRLICYLMFLVMALVMLLT